MHVFMIMMQIYKWLALCRNLNLLEIYSPAPNTEYFNHLCLQVWNFSEILQIIHKAIDIPMSYRKIIKNMFG